MKIMASRAIRYARNRENYVTKTHIYTYNKYTHIYNQYIQEILENTLNQVYLFYMFLKHALQNKNLEIWL